MRKKSIFGIDVGRFPEALETEQSDDTLRFKEFEHLDYKEYGPKNKYRNFDVEFLSPNDESYKDLENQGVKEAPLDNFDGRMIPGDLSMQDNMFKYEPTSAYELKDYSDLYDNYEFSIIAKMAKRVKVSHIIPGDTVLIMRPDRYLTSYNKLDRVAKVLDTQDNGWLLVCTMRGQKIAIYAGNSDEDDDVQKLDFDQLEQVYRHKISSHSRRIFVENDY